MSVPASTMPRPRTPIGRVTGKLAKRENTFLLGIVAILILIFSVLAPSGTFFSSGNFTSIALDTSEILVLSAGMTFVIIAAGLDLSVGSVVVFSSVIFAKLIAELAGTAGSLGGQAHHLAIAIPISVLAAIASGAAWGLVNGWITARWAVPPFIVTLGTLGMALGFAQVITGGLNVPNVPVELQLQFGSKNFLGIPWLVWVAAVVVAVLWVVLAKTRYGLRTYAIGANAEGARRAGVNVTLHTISLYVLMGSLAGLVAVMDVARFDTASIAAHTQDNLAAIAAVVIGGTSLFGGKGRMSGTIIGAFIPAILRNGFILLDVQPFWQNVAVGGVLILAVYIDQQRRRRQFIA
jgi:ribose transport system permease protein